VASDRIGKKAANLVAVPPFEVKAVTTNFILAQPTVEENIRNVPLNKPLVESILKDGIKNPHLLMHSWYPIAGSQRIRAVAHIRDEIDENYNINITVHRFLGDYHNVFYLWSDTEFRSKAIAIWFQMQEVVFKSLYYPHETDGQGTKMTDYEDLGEKLKWEHDRSNTSNDSDPNSDNVGC
jgi:hypothetical protein